MPADLILTLAGGAVGSVVTVGFTGLARFGAARSEVAAHDEQVGDLNTDLRLWIADDYRKLTVQLTALAGELNHPDTNLFYSGAHGQRRSEEKSAMLHRYRDRVNTAIRDLHAIERSEGQAHRFWRNWDNRSFPSFTAPDDMRFVLDDVRRPTTKHGGEATVFDPTRFDLDALRRDVAQNPLEPAAAPPSRPSVSTADGDPPALPDG